MHRDTFFRFYANLPLSVRKELVLDLGEEKGGPITWEVAYREIKGSTPRGEIILKKLIELGFVPVGENE